MTWTKLSTQIFRNGTIVKKYFDKDAGGVLKCTEFAKGSRMYNVGIGSARLYSFKGKPVTFNVYTAKAANGRAAGAPMDLPMLNVHSYKDFIQMLRAYIKRGS